MLDAASGELLSAQPFAPVNWTTGIDLKTGRPVMNPAARYDRTGKGFILQPSFAGAHSWHPMSYSPLTGLVYIPTMNYSYPFVATREDDNPMGQKLSISFAGGAKMLADPKALKVNNGYLLAWDPVKQQEAWRVSYEEGRGGGTLATAGGLVFQGNTKTQEFVAYRADNGQRLWGMNAQTGVVAGPATYEVDGEQYVAVVAGYRQRGNYYASNHSRLLTYKLGGTAQLPPVVPEQPQVLSPPPQFGSADMLKHGEATYGRFCGTCHGTDGQSRGMFPDLRYSGALGSPEALKAIVIDGVLAKNGMVSFKSALTPEDVEAVRAYMVSRAHDAVKNGIAGPGAPGLPGQLPKQQTPPAAPSAHQ